jgi:phosphatidylethanolamine N-methyltransferase
MAISLELLGDFIGYIDLSDKMFLLSMIMIVICPVTWNLIARWEFHTKIFTKITGDNRLAADIFAHILIEMGVFRNYIFEKAISRQMRYPIDSAYCDYIYSLGCGLAIFGGILVLMAYYRLGIHGIYYADYFGLLMKEKVTVFPYNLVNNPLYIGSTSIFLGLSVMHLSPAGVLLTILVWFMYKLASLMENPMTDLIYSVHNIKAVEKMKREREEREIYPRITS